MERGYQGKKTEHMGGEGGVTLHWETTSFLSNLDLSFPVIHPIEEPVMTFLWKGIISVVCTHVYVCVCMCGCVRVCGVGDAMHRHK